MANGADARIVIDTKLDNKGFKAGSKQLLSALTSLSRTVNGLGPSFQKAMGGGEAAVASFIAKADALEDRISYLRQNLDALGKNNIQTEEYSILVSAAERAGKALERLYSKQEKMQNSSVKENSKQWQNLQFDIQQAEQEMARFEARKAQLEKEGKAFVSGVDTAQYQQMESELNSLISKLAEMQAAVDQTNARWSQMSTLSEMLRYSFERTLARISSAASTLKNAVVHPIQTADHVLGSLVKKAGQAAAALKRLAVNKFTSGLKSAAKHAGTLARNLLGLRNPFAGLTSSMKRLISSLLMTEGILGLLRKAVSAYMQENEQLSATLSSCWSGIGNILGQIITRLVNLVSTAVSYVTQFLSLLGLVGSSTTKAISKAGGSAKKETDKLKRSLASFDELTILQHNDDEDSGGGSTVAKPAQTELPDWAKLIAENLKAGNWKEAATILTSQLNSMVTNADWAGLGSKIGYYLNGALTFLATAILTFNWVQLGANLAVCLNNVLHNVDWANLGVVLGWKLLALLGLLHGFVTTFEWATLGQAIADSFMGLWNAIDWEQAAVTLSEGTIGILTTLSTAISQINWQEIGNDVAKFIGGIDWSGVFEALCKGVGVALGGLAAFLWGIIEAAWAEVVEWWYDVAFEDGEFTMGGLLEGILKGLGDIVSWLWNNVCEPIIKGIKEGFGIHSPSKVMSELGDYLTQGLKEGITKKWADIPDFFKTSLSDLISTIQNKDWSDVGSNICSGIGEGISSGWSWLKKKVNNLATNMLDAAKSALDIHSPSRLFRDEVGYMLGLGVAEGMEESQPEILNSVTGIADQISAEMASSGSTIPLNAETIGAVDGLDNVLTKFADRVCGGFESVINRMNAIAASASFKVPAVASGAVVPLNQRIASAVSGHTEAPLATIQEAVALVMDDYAAANLAGQEAIVSILREILEAVLGIEIGDEVIGQAVSRYNRKMAVVRGGV